jgi:hypothetical protein
MHHLGGFERNDTVDFNNCDRMYYDMHPKSRSFARSVPRYPACKNCSRF